MKICRVMVAVTFLAVAADAGAEVVKGWVRLETTPSIVEVAE